MDMKDQRFGIEVEMTGLTRQQAAQVAAEHFGSSVHFDGTYYGIYSTLDSEGRQWKFMSDGSIDTQKKSGRQIVSADSDYSVEMVSPRRMPLHALPKAWTPGTAGVVEGEVVIAKLDSLKALELVLQPQPKAKGSKA